jgi:hypothetical protein
MTYGLLGQVQVAVFLTLRNRAIILFIRLLGALGPKTAAGTIVGKANKSKGCTDGTLDSSFHKIYSVWFFIFRQSHYI